jgi:3-oxoacyl-[acyl-carrier protein] reductase
MNKKKVMLITGASRGIGAAIAYEASMTGYFVVINYNKSERDAETLCEKIKKDGGECIAVKADITSSSDVEHLCDEALLYSGKIDVLVNNAGISSFSLFTDISDELWDQTFDIFCDTVLFVFH